MKNQQTLRSRPRLRLRSLTLAILLVAVSDAASAYKFGGTLAAPERWATGSPIVMHMRLVTFPGPSPHDPFVNGVVDAMNLWNDVKGCSLAFYAVNDPFPFTYGVPHIINGQNEIYFDLSSNSLVENHLRIVSGKIVEADIRITGLGGLNKWHFDDGLFSHTYMPTVNFKGLMLHALGAALGLKHEDGVLATMNSLYPYGGPLGYWKAWKPLADDRAGARFLFPDTGTEIDVAGSGRAGTQASAPAPEYVTYSSFMITAIPITVHNLSTSTQTIPVYFYISNDVNITTSDPALGGMVLSLAGGATTTFWAGMLIPPGSAPPGSTRWLGFIIDPSGTLSEGDTTNNAQPIPVQLKIVP